MKNNQQSNYSQGAIGISMGMPWAAGFDDEGSNPGAYTPEVEPSKQPVEQQSNYSQGALGTSMGMPWTLAYDKPGTDIMPYGVRLEESGLTGTTTPTTKSHTMLYVILGVTLLLVIMAIIYFV